MDASLPEKERDRPQDHKLHLTLQTLAVYASGLFLGRRNGALAMGLYLLVGMFFPVFAGGGFGPAYLFGAASAGYLADIRAQCAATTTAKA